MPQTLESAFKTAKKGQPRQLLDEVDKLRAIAFVDIADAHRSQLGQYPTPPKVAVQMAAMFQNFGKTIRLLDPGAGIGSLSAAFVSHTCGLKLAPTRLKVTAFEVDHHLIGSLSQTLAKCGDLCSQSKIAFEGHIKSVDFIVSAVDMLKSGLFASDGSKFDCAILNPPYKKIGALSEHRKLLRQVGIETTNLYAAFLALAILLLKPGGELVAITPRSFCNGPYFKPFRELFLRETCLTRVHLFESRKEAFADDQVLQENVIFHATKDKRQPTTIQISSGRGPDQTSSVREITYDELVKPGDPENFIHIVSDENGGRISELMSRLKCSLAGIGLSISTGRVVDFRCQEWLRFNPGPNTAPLIYPTHFSEGWISWPKLGHKKPNAYLSNHESAKWLIPAAVHVLTKRFSAKEEKRRIVAAVFDPAQIPSEKIAFENHVNYFHENGRGLSMDLAKGLTVFLNSTAVDTYFRQFNGHTQVNASDLRNLRYPTRAELEKLGKRIGRQFPEQRELDRLFDEGFLKWRKR